MEEKNLKELLQSDVVVPEIQRDYVWGNNQRVLNQFITDIRCKGNLTIEKIYKPEDGKRISQFISEIKNEIELNVGFVYSYKPYQELNEIFLIDGQQRITTLVLIAFYCAIQEKKLEEFKLLIKISDPKPAFSYRVRSCTKDFMIKLFKSVDNLDNLRTIKDQKWFLDRFKSDYSIESMINAIKVIDEYLKNSFNLYNYIVENVKFWYFNVGETSQGEELYITMNSRGESLSEAEKIKPLLFEKITDPIERLKFGKLWDDIEEYFYALKPSNKGIEVVDKMMNRFIQLILQIENSTGKFIDRLNSFTTEEIQKIDLQKIEYYFFSLKLIDSNFKEKKDTEKISLLTCFIEEEQESKFLLPLAALQKAVSILINIYNKPSKFSFTSDQHREMLRLYHVVRNAVRRGTINYVPLLKLMSNYDGTKSIYEFFIGNYKVENTKEIVLSPHEIEKIKIISNSESIEKTEEAFWEAQESLEYLLSGSLKPLIEPFIDEEKWTETILKKFQNRRNIICEVFSNEYIKIELSKEHIVGRIDNALISRALLTFGDYSKTFKGTNKCFGFNDNWKDIFKEEKGFVILNSLITKLSELPETLTMYEKLNSIIKNYLDNYDISKKDAKYYFVKYQNTFRAIEHGQNFICFWRGWNDYRIEVLNWSNLNSFHINPFVMATVYELKIENQRSYIKCLNKDNSHSNIGLINGITLSCYSEHGWLVKSEKHIDNLEWNEVEKGYMYVVDLKDDLIEKGVELFYKLKDLE